MTELNVNVDHVATIRQARMTSEPDPVLAAYLAEIAGASGIVAHLREDRRHIQERDLRVLHQTVKTKLNMEMAPTEEMVHIALDIVPNMVTLVPERRDEITTEGGLDVVQNFESVSKVVAELKGNGLFVSLFIDPNQQQIDSAKEAGAQMVEIHTGNYAEAMAGENGKEIKKELKKIQTAARSSKEIGLRVAAGHGLNYLNVKKIAGIDEIEELNIGHSIVSRAQIVGFEKAVREMIQLCRQV